MPRQEFHKQTKNPNKNKSGKKSRFHKKLKNLNNPMSLKQIRIKDYWSRPKKLPKLLLKNWSKINRV